MNKIVLVDDDKFMLRYVQDHLENWGYLVIALNDGARVTPEFIREANPLMVMLDMIMPGRSGVDILKEIHPRFPDLPMILFTAFGTIETAVEAIRHGAYDYITKPIDMGRLEILVKNAARASALARKVEAYEAGRHGDIIGASDKMRGVFETIDVLAGSDASVLITGETGTGKELVAAAIHRRSPRALKAFVPVNCGALPEGIIESELFGHVRGAFTGAVRDKKGRFELADGGTIFLDEVGDLPPATQVKLLRVLQEGTFERVGSEETVRIDVRVISATNRDLKIMMSRGEFREDLFYRLCVVPVHVPPLRERRTDIPLLADHFLRSFAATRKDASFSNECLDLLMDFHWPGNVRQLQNAIQFALIKCKSGPIGPEHLPPEIFETDEPIHSGGAETRLGRKPILEKSAVLNALREAGGNKARAARILGVGRATLYRFMTDNDISAW